MKYIDLISEGNFHRMMFSELEVDFSEDRWYL